MTQTEILAIAFDCIDVWDWREDLDEDFAAGKTKAEAVRNLIECLEWFTDDLDTPDGLDAFEYDIQRDSYLILNRSEDKLYRKYKEGSSEPLFSFVAGDVQV